jgi:hypothetical protein
VTGRINLLSAVILTICGAGAITLAALGGHSVLGNYLWPANAMIWCWLWYGATRTNRRLAGGAR